MSVGTTSIESLPNEIGKNNVNLTIKETPQPKGPTPTQLSKDSINQIVSGLQDAAGSGLTSLPSRDLPMNNQHISQDEQQKPNYIPEPENNDYIEDNSDFESIFFINLSQSTHCKIDSEHGCLRFLLYNLPYVVITIPSE